MGKKSDKKMSNRYHSDDDDNIDNEYDQQIKKYESTVPEEDAENDDECTTDIDDNELWNIKESTQLIELMRKQIPSKDKHSYNHTISKLNWSLINIPNKSTDQCKNHLAELLKKARRVRILNEVLTEIEELLVKGVYDHKKRASAYSLFCQDIKKTIGNSSNFFTEASKLFKNLPENKRQLYQQKSEQINLLSKVGAKNKTSKKAKQKKVISFYCDEQFRMGNTDKQQTRKDFFKLDDEAKLKWIKFAISTDKSYEQMLTKEEKLILSLNGKPRRAPSAMNLFIKDYFAKNDSANISSAQTEYQKLTEKERKYYNKLAERAKLKYNRDMTAYKLGILDGQIEESFIKAEESDDEDEDNNDAKSSNLSTPMKKPPTNDRDKSKLHAKQIEKSSLSTIIDPKCENLSDEDLSVILSSPKTRKKTISMSQDENVFSDDSSAKLKKSLKSKKHSSHSQEVNDEQELNDKSSQLNKRKNQEKSLKSKKRKKNHSSQESQEDESDLNDSQLLSQEGASDDTLINKANMKQFDANESLLSSTKIKSKSLSPVKSITGRKYPEPDKPASSTFEYFTKHFFNGKSKHARREYDNLSKEKKKELKRDHRKQIADYRQNLNLFLSQLSEKELIAWSKENDTNE